MPLKAPAGTPPGFGFLWRWFFCAGALIGLTLFSLARPGGSQSMSVPVAVVQALPAPKLLGGRRQKRRSCSADDQAQRRAAYSLSCTVGAAVAPAFAITARLILFRPSFRTAVLGPKSIFHRIAVPTIATIRAIVTDVAELPSCIHPSVRPA